MNFHCFMVNYLRFLYTMFLNECCYNDPVHDVETIFGICTQLTAYGNYFWNISDGQ